MKIRLYLLTLMVIGFYSPAWSSNGNGQTIVVIDTGFDKTHPANYFTKSACFSKKEIVTRRSISTTSTNIEGYLYKDNDMSKCPNGENSQSGSSSSFAVNMPTRKLIQRYEESAATYITYNYFTVRHGTNVVRQVSNYAPLATIFPISIGVINKDENCTTPTFNSVPHSNTGTTRVYDSNYTFSSATGCSYSTRTQLLDGLSHILTNPSGIVAINISSGVPNEIACNSQQGRSIVTSLNNQGIAVIAAVGNVNGQNVNWPACLSNVIGVAQTNSAGNPVSSSIKDNKYDFFFSGVTTDYKTGGTISGTSFAAPKVAGIYANLKSVNPQASIDDITNVLKNTGKSINGFSGKLIDLPSAISEIKKVTNTPPTTPPPPPAQPPTPPGQTAELGVSYDGVYGIGSVFSLNLNGNSLVSNSANIALSTLSNANLSVTNVRDISLTFEGEFYKPNGSSSNSGIDIIVNGVSRINFDGAQSDLNNIYFKNYSFMLNRNWLKSGLNTISIAPATGTSPLSGRVASVKMDYNPPVQIVDRKKNTKLYGHRVGTKTHLTGLRVEFASLTSNAEFSVTGFDIDSATEIAVFLNQKRIGYLKRGSNSNYNSGDIFELKKQDFVSTGVNTIEFVQTSSSDKETWGVINMELIGVSPPNISGALMLLLDE